MREKMWYIIFIGGLCLCVFGVFLSFYLAKQEKMKLSYEDSWLLKNPSGIVIIAGPECGLDRAIAIGVAHEVGPALFLFKPGVYK